MLDRYDVFVSYSSSDRAWVDADLLPPLEQGGLQVCIDHRDFDVGIPFLENMKNALERSHCTVLVLTPEWVGSTYAEFEGLFAALGRRLFPIWLRDCVSGSIPPDISRLTAADCRIPESILPELQRLAGQIKAFLARLNAVAPAAGNSDPPAKDTTQFALQTVCGRIDLVGDYKDIHNELHDIQFQCHATVIRNLDRLPKDDPDWDELADCAQELQEIVQRLREIASRIPDRNLPWIRGVESASAALSQAIEHSDKAKLTEFRRRMTSVLASQPTYIVVRLNEAAQGLLPELKRLENSQGAATVSVERDLRMLIDRHDNWQVLDGLIRNTDPETEPSEYWWRDIQDASVRCCACTPESATGGFRRALEALKGAIDAQDGTEILRQFKALGRQSGLVFHRVDIDLKRLLDQLRTLDGPYGYLRTAS